MAISLHSFSLVGLEARPVEVEIQTNPGLPYFGVIGMAGKSVTESRDRVRCALQQSGFRFPMNRKVANLAPADLPKKGSHFDLAIALGVLASSGHFSELEDSFMAIGELGLDGSVKPVRGVMSAVLMAREMGLKSVIVPEANAGEASLVKGIEVFSARDLREVVEHVTGNSLLTRVSGFEWNSGKQPWTMNDVYGHSGCKRALMIAAAGGHHVLMSGPPGTGKSLLARAFASLLPLPSEDEKLEILQIASAAYSQIDPSSCHRPFRSVPSSCTPLGLIGGGPELRAGEITLAHRGVLFLDEIAEFERKTLELLRQPLEEGKVELRFRNLQARYPAQFQLVAAMNPCPCGYYGDREKSCKCSAAQIQFYQNKISGPLMDRIDMHLHVPRIGFSAMHLGGDKTDFNSSIMLARERQHRRLGKGLNAHMSTKEVKELPLSLECQKMLEEFGKQYALSGRSLHRIIKMGRSIADIDEEDRIDKSHLMEALHYRGC